MDEILYPAQLKYLSGVRQNEDPLILELEDYAKEKKIPILDWKSAEFLEMLIRLHRPKLVLELGTAIAYSSIRIARVLRKKGVLHTIEKSLDNIPLAKRNIERAGVGKKIKILEGDARELMPGMKREYDFIFLDADKEDYEHLLDLSMLILRKRGIIFVDNLLWHGFTAAESVPKKFQVSTEHIRKFNQKFLHHPELHASIFPVGDGIGVGVRK